MTTESIAGKTQFFQAKIVEVEVEDGVYQGTQSGYNVVFNYNGRDVYFQSSTGVRGLDVPCRVVVYQGYATVNFVSVT